ncbi:IclR family transcriptional regulator [Pseudopontixanthobacter vadosimaris]|uniref:IclR family transcriptional regulator n=1 Tax=Pseudopontixanthobacter vadosimaris TaxID=2726450 RepID=UPI001475BE03|nr:IclR family transcriptional regulator C-terminal domain-containing protein [Pseudopontixanthobacter vadosimaris]
MPRLVKSVSRAAAILRLLSVGEPRGVNAVARELALAPSTCLELLRTLLHEELVDFEPGRKTYATVSDLRTFFTESADVLLSDVLRTGLRRFARDHLVTCGIWSRLGTRVILKEVFDSPDSTRIHLVAGQRLPVHLGAMGRCLAAVEGLEREEVAEIVTSLRWQSPPSASNFSRDVENARVHGWALDDGNYLRGIATIAVALPNHSGKVKGFVTATGFAGQRDMSEYAKMGWELQGLAGCKKKS